MTEKNEPQLRITLFERDNKSDVLSKRISADPETGAPVSDGSACRMGAGKLQVKQVENLADMGKIISKMPSNIALALGVPRDGTDKADVVTAANATAKPTAKTRSLRDMHFAKGAPAFMLIDVDYKGAPDAVIDAVERDGIGGILEEVLPHLSEYGQVRRSSTSSGLRNAKTGENFAERGGQHIYVPIVDGSDMKRALDVLAKRLWLAGYGWIMIGAAGQQLVRCPVDVSVASPERLVFEGAPIIVAPIEQDAEARKAHVKEGGFLDTEVCLEDLTPLEEAAYESRVAQKKNACLHEALAIREKHDDKLVKELAARTQMPVPAAKKQIADRHKKLLGPDVKLYLDDGREVTCGEVLDNWAAFVGLTLADPIEPSYGTTKARIMEEPDPDGYKTINSFAHGGALYRLQLGMRHVEANINNAATEHALTLFADAVYRSNLDAGGLVRAKALLKSVHDIGAKLANDAIKADKARRKAERAAKARVDAAQAAAHDDRPSVHIPDISAPWSETFANIDTILSDIDAPEPPMRDGQGRMAKIARVSIPSAIEMQTATEKESGVTPAPAKALSIRAISGVNAAVETEKFIRWYKQVTVDGETVNVPTNLPNTWINSYAGWDGSNCPEVIAVTELPLVMEGQNIIAPDGLDRPMRTFFSIDPAITVRLPKKTVTAKKAADAYRFLADEMLADVLTGEKGKAVLIAAMLTMIEAPLLAERPAFIITASRRGGGKSTVAMMMGLAVYGQRPAADEWSSENEERRKNLMAQLLAGVRFLVFDDMPLGAVIKCSVVNKILTSGKVSDRILGQSQIMTALATVVLIWTGNNISASGDLASRTLTTEIEVLSTRPEDRDFKHPDVFGWIRDNRPKILSALYTILMVERPAQKGKIQSRFKRWMDLVGIPIEIASQGEVSFVDLLTENEGAGTDADADAMDIIMGSLIDAFAGSAHISPEEKSLTRTFTPKELITELVAGAYAKEPYPPGNSTFGVASYNSPYGTSTGNPQADFQTDMNIYRTRKDLAENFIDALETVAGGARFSAHREPAATAVGKKLQKIMGRPNEWKGTTVRLQSFRNPHTKGTDYWIEEIGAGKEE